MSLNRSNSIDKSKASIFSTSTTNSQSRYSSQSNYNTK